MITAQVIYTGNLRTEAKHVASGAEIITDAPLDNHGKGEAFSPTDLVATALASCMLTVMAIQANSMGIDLAGSTANIEKKMVSSPRRIAVINIDLQMKGVEDKQAQAILEKIATTCPVYQSLHPEIDKQTKFRWQ